MQLFVGLLLQVGGERGFEEMVSQVVEFLSQLVLSMDFEVDAHQRLNLIHSFDFSYSI
ncbi:MAG: hypothetical protein KGM16_12170 [Bacteroidota bacterium]|nr:hypothetical protein [Bacteroidota bacterium]